MGSLKNYLNISILKNKYINNFLCGLVTNPFNPLTRDRLSRVVKFLAHHIMSRVGFTYFQPDSW